jgi:hypothetical protein
MGPSLPLAEARALFPADYRPPARMGDVYAELSPDLAGIVLIDGVFHGQPAVWHRELLAALDGGIPVLGAASMGALRAAELEPFGMIGVGTVFGWYRGGRLDRDDAVALLHGPAESGWTPLSLPLVSLIATLETAVAAGDLGEGDAEELRALADARPFGERSERVLLEDARRAGWTASRLARARSALATHARDVKREDARAALREAALRAARAEAAGAAPVPEPGAAAPPAPLPRWRRDRLLRATLDGVLGEERARALAGDGQLRARVALEGFALAWAAAYGAGRGGLSTTQSGARSGARAEAGEAPVPTAGAHRAGVLAREARALAERRALLERIDRELGGGAGRGGGRGGGLVRAARLWAEAMGIDGPDGAPAAAEWLLERGPDGLGLPWEWDVALIEAWQTDVLLGRPRWADGSNPTAPTAAAAPAGSDLAPSPPAESR